MNKKIECNNGAEQDSNTKQSRKTGQDNDTNWSKKTEQKNEAFIDGQNLFLGTTMSREPWQIDLHRFRRYLREKYRIMKAYYFLGCMSPEHGSLYNLLYEAGFTLVFREHSEELVSSKKGNVDTDIVFTMMRDFHEEPGVDKFFLVSGDGDYYRTTKYLRDKGKLGKVLFPSKKAASGLYRSLEQRYRAFLDTPSVKNKIMYTSEN